MKSFIIKVLVVLSFPFLAMANSQQEMAYVDSLVDVIDPAAHHGIVEENNLWYPPGVEVNGMTEEIFNQVLDHVYKVYEPIFKARGAEFVIERRWNDGTVNAFARQVGNRWIIRMFGGLARHETITPDGFYLVACHEIGHHLGGAPKYNGTGWASNEGQSDYFATLKCLRKVWAQDDNIGYVEYMWAMESPFVDEYAMEMCMKAHQDPRMQALCGRMSMGGQSLAFLFQALRRLPTPPKFNTPDQSKVRRTSDSHPQPQCRMDTYFQGALCPISVNEGVDDRDPIPGTCNRASSHPYGLRPLCWFAPESAFTFF